MEGCKNVRNKTRKGQYETACKGWSMMLLMSMPVMGGEKVHEEEFATVEAMAEGMAKSPNVD
jgi:hypothetical protein